jgi:hypothetical protein
MSQALLLSYHIGPAKATAPLCLVLPPPPPGAALFFAADRFRRSMDIDMHKAIWLARRTPLSAEGIRIELAAASPPIFHLSTRFFLSLSIHEWDCKHIHAAMLFILSCLNFKSSTEDFVLYRSGGNKYSKEEDNELKVQIGGHMSETNP